MSTRDFAPRPMKLSILTAAFQELTPRERRDPDPDLAIEEWLEFARVIGSPNIQLSAALHPTLSDVPEEAMLDPVANTLDLRAPFDTRPGASLDICPAATSGITQVRAIAAATRAKKANAPIARSRFFAE